jgi:UDP-N-acetylmuramate: L-alanyl-gamma-D-glutamyl-meso-diaminopimelate ligase
MHIHILGICGTFMAGLAVIARQAGHRVTGSDENVYPPMSTMLEQQGVAIMQGYEAAHLQPAPDCIVVGNAMTRGNPAVEYLLDEGLPYTSGPQWLSEHVLRGRHVLAVAGTHGKTTTTSMLAWILEHAGLAPGFLIGGVPANFGVSARIGQAPYFVIEADEYDTAFFDKRSKFVHYRPRTLVLGNLEYDHADIFPDLAAIQRQVHHVVRIVPASGRIVVNGESSALAQTLRAGSWSAVERFGWADPRTEGRNLDWQLSWPDGRAAGAGASPEVVHRGQVLGRLELPAAPGRYNQENAVSAIAAAEHIGVPVPTALDALRAFSGVARRLEPVAGVAAVHLFDDFAHHPTAVERTLEAVRERMTGANAGNARLLVAVEPRSNSMRMGIHAQALPRALARADAVWMYSPPGLEWDPRRLLAGKVEHLRIMSRIDDLAADLAGEIEAGDYVVMMSNGGFGDLRGRMVTLLQQRFAAL